MSPVDGVTEAMPVNNAIASACTFFYNFRFIRLAIAVGVDYVVVTDYVIQSSPELSLIVKSFSGLQYQGQFLLILNCAKLNYFTSQQVQKKT